MAHDAAQEAQAAATGLRQPDGRVDSLVSCGGSGESVAAEGGAQGTRKRRRSEGAADASPVHSAHDSPATAAVDLVAPQRSPHRESHDGHRAPASPSAGRRRVEVEESGAAASGEASTATVAAAGLAGLFAAATAHSDRVRAQTDGTPRLDGGRDTSGKDAAKRDAAGAARSAARSKPKSRKKQLKSQLWRERKQREQRMVCVSRMLVQRKYPCLPRLFGAPRRRFELKRRASGRRCRAGSGRVGGVIAEMPVSSVMMELKVSKEHLPRRRMTCASTSWWESVTRVIASWRADLQPLLLTHSAVCTGEMCRFDHDYSAHPCRFFHTQGPAACAAGDSCKFSHAVPLTPQMRERLDAEIARERAAVARAGAAGPRSAVPLQRSVPAPPGIPLRGPTPRVAAAAPPPASHSFAAGAPSGRSHSGATLALSALRPHEIGGGSGNT